MAAHLRRLFPYEPQDGSILTLIISVMMLRLITSLYFPMGVDETYAIVVSRFPTLSYFDHPPLGFDFARAVAWATGSEAPFVVRFPHVIMGTLSSWYLYKITARLFGIQAAFYAVAWYSAAPFFFISSGHFVVPDGPLNLFLVLGLWWLLPLFDGDHSLTTRQWVNIGIAMALALMSKYQAVLFGVAVAIAVLWNPQARKSLATKGPWLALLIAALGMIPMIYWNSQHEWISFKFQSGRAGNGLTLYSCNFLLTLAGQMVYVLPGSWLMAQYFAASAIIKPNREAERLLGIIVLLPVVIFDVIALISEKSLPHWPMSGFLFAFPLLGLGITTLPQRFQTILRLVFRPALIGIFLTALLVSAQTHTAFLTRFSFAEAPRYDLDSQLVGWDALRLDFQQRNLLESFDTFIIPSKWSEGGRAGYALGPQIPVAIPLNDPRHFSYTGDARLSTRANGYIVFEADLGDAKSEAPGWANAAADRYVTTGNMWTITQTRMGFPAFDIGVIPVRRR